MNDYLWNQLCDEFYNDSNFLLYPCIQKFGVSKIFF